MNQNCLWGLGWLLLSWTLVCCVNVTTIITSTTNFSKKVCVCVCVCAHMCIFYPHPRILLLTWERDWEVWERETSIDCFPHMPDLGIKHTTFRCMEHWFKQLSHLARAVCVFLKPSSICVNSNDYAIEALWSYLTLRGLVRIATQLNDGINKIRFHVLQIGSRYYSSPR